MGLVIVVDKKDDFISGVATVLAPKADIEVRRAASIDDSRVSAAEPHVVVAGPSTDASACVAFARSQASHPRRAAVIMVAETIDTDLMRDAMRAGVSDVVQANAPASELLEAIMSAYDASVNRREAEQPCEPTLEPANAARVVTVFSTKGGVGKSVLATNIGSALASTLDKRTVLVDLDLQFGDVAIMLGLEPKRTILDAVHNIDRLDVDMLAGYLTTHDSGLQVLLAPVNPEDAETITTGRIAKILGLLSEMFDYVVIDTAATFDEVVLTALDKSTHVFAVTMMDVASIKNTRVSLQKLTQLGYDHGFVHLVLNRADSKVWLQPAEVEKAVGSEVYAKIPSDRIVPRSVNKGTPVVIDEPRSDVAKAIVEIAQGVVRSAEEVATNVA